MKIEQMTSPKGNKVPNQFIIFTPEATFFQSYQTIVAKTTFEDGKRVVILDENWEYSKTTSKYRNQFLGETTQETRKKVKNGTYKVESLN